MNDSISRPNFNLQNTGTVQKSHSIILRERNHLEITGVTDVLKFDDLSAELATVLGDLFVDGEELHMETFDTERGAVILSGRFRTLDYSDPESNIKKAEKKHLFFGKR